MPSLTDNTDTPDIPYLISESGEKLTTTQILSSSNIDEKLTTHHNKS
jgi:hypothetical protein